MTWVVVLDTGVLGYLTHPKANANATECAKWLRELLSEGVRVCLPEVCDYELRREYLRRSKTEVQARVALDKLDQLKSSLEYLEIGTPVMLLAAQLWADARSRGRPTADSKELDCDVILAAQSQLTAAGERLTIATNNAGHLSDFADARAFIEIPPRGGSSIPA